MVLHSFNTGVLVRLEYPPKPTAKQKMRNGKGNTISLLKTTKRAKAGAVNYMRIRKAAGGLHGSNNPKRPAGRLPLKAGLTRVRNT